MAVVRGFGVESQQLLLLVTLYHLFHFMSCVKLTLFFQFILHDFKYLRLQLSLLISVTKDNNK